MSVSGFKINGVLEKYKYRELEDISVVENDIANGAVTESKIGAGAITRSKLALDVNDFLEGKADIDGVYTDMTTGLAEQLKSNTGVNDQVPYNFRASGGGVELGNKARIDAIVGGTVVWNQLFTSTLEDGSKNGIEYVVNEDGSFTFNGTADSDKTTRIQFANNGDTVLPIDHVFFIDGIHGGSASTYYFTITNSGANADNIYNPTIYKRTGTTANQFSFRVAADATISNISVQPQIYDLTAMFGSEIADYILGLEQANAGAGIEWFRRLFPYSDYVEDTGTLRSVKTSGHKMVGFNQFSPSSIKFCGSSCYNKAAGTILDLKDTSSVVTADVTDPTDISFTNTVNYRGLGFLSSNKLVKGQNYSINYRISGDDTAKIKRSFYVLDHDYRITRRVANSNGVDMDSDHIYITNIPSIQEGEKYIMLWVESATAQTIHVYDFCMHLKWDGERDGEYEPYIEYNYPFDSDLELRGIPKLDANNKLYYDGDVYKSNGTVLRKYAIRPYESGDDSLADAITDGTNTVYKLDTPTTESADPYQQIQNVFDWGTEEYIGTDTGRPVGIPVGHITFYQANLKAKLEMAPDSPSEGDGLYVVQHTNGKNTYVPLNESTVGGVLVLTETVSGGTHTLNKTWQEIHDATAAKIPCFVITDITDNYSTLTMLLVSAVFVDSNSYYVAVGAEGAADYQEFSADSVSGYPSYTE